MAMGDVVKSGVDTYGVSYGGSQASFISAFAGNAVAQAGNLLVALVGVTNYQSGGFTFSATATGTGVTAPDGWNIGLAFPGSYQSSALFWRIADGHENGVTMVAAGGAGLTGWGKLFEIDATGLNLSALHSSASNNTFATTATTSISTGTASGVAASNGLAIAFFAHDSGPAGLDTSAAYTNGFARFARSGVDANYPGLHAAMKTITAGSNETTFSSSLNETAFAGIVVWDGAPLVPQLGISGTTGSIAYGSTFTAALSNGGSAGTASLVQGSFSTALSIGAWGDTYASLSIPAIATTQLVPGSAVLRMVNAAGKVATLAVTLEMPAGKNLVTLTSVASTGLVPTDQPLVVGASILADAFVQDANGDITTYPLVINADGTWAIGGGAPGNGAQYQFARRVRDPADGSWGTEAIATVTLYNDADMVADAFTIGAKTGVEPGITVESDPFAPTGYDPDVEMPVTVASGLQYSVSLDGGNSWGGYTGAATTVQHVSGQPLPQFKVNVLSAALGLSVTRAFSFGSVSANFVVATRAAVVPVLSGISASRASATSVSWGVTTNTATGTLRVLVSTNASESATTVKASGQSVAVTSAGAKSGTVGSVTTGSTVYVHVVHVGEADSVVLSSAAVLVAADAVPGQIVAPTGSIKSASGANLTHTYEHWLITAQADIDAAMEAGSVASPAASGANLAVSNGGFTVDLTDVAFGAYTLIAWSGGTGNLKEHYVRLPVTVGAP